MDGRRTLIVRDNLVFVAHGSNVFCYHKDKENGNQLQSYTRHTALVTALHLSGDTLFTASIDNTAKAFNIKNGQCSTTFAGHSGAVTCLTVSNGLLFTGSEDQSAKAWDPRTGACVRTYRGHQGAVWCLAVAANETRDGSLSLFTGSLDATLRKFDVATGQSIVTFTGHRRDIFTLYVHRNTLFSGSRDGVVKAWNVTTGQPGKSFKNHTRAVRCLYFDPESHTLFSGADDHRVIAWNVISGDITRSFAGAAMGISDICLLRGKGGAMLFAASHDKNAYAWDVSTGQQVATYTAHSHGIIGVALAGSEGLVTHSRDGTARLWNVRQTQPLRMFVSTGREISAFQVDRHHGVVYAAYANDEHHSVYVLDMRRGGTIKEFRGQTEDITCMVLADGVLYTGGEDNRIIAWGVAHDTDVTSDAFGRMLGAMEGHDDWVLSLHAEWGMLFSGSADTTVKQWDVSTRQLVHTYDGHDGPVYSIATDAVNSMLVTGGGDAKYKVWRVGTGASNTHTGVTVCELVGQAGSDWLWDVAVADGVVYGASWNNAVHSWDIQTGGFIRSYDGHTKPVRCVSVVDGQLFTGSDDTTVRVFDTKTGRRVRTYIEHAAPVTAMHEVDGTVYTASTDIFAFNGKLLARGIEEKHQLWHPQPFDRPHGNSVELGFAVALLTLVALQTASLAFTPQVWGDSAPGLVSFFTSLRTFGIADQLPLAEALGVVAVFVFLLAGIMVAREPITTSMFTDPHNPGLRVVWSLMSLGSKFITMGMLLPLASVLVETGNCHPTSGTLRRAPGIACGSDDHVGLVFVAGLLGGLHALMVTRMLRVGVELDNIVMKLNPLDWSDDRFVLRREHPLSLSRAGRSRVMWVAALLVSLPFLTVLLAGGNNRVSYSSFQFIFMVLGGVLLALDYKYPAYVSVRANMARTGADASIAWSAFIGWIASVSTVRTPLLFLWGFLLLVVGPAAIAVRTTVLDGYGMRRKRSKASCLPWSSAVQIEEEDWYQQMMLDQESQATGQPRASLYRPIVSFNGSARRTAGASHRKFGGSHVSGRVSRGTRDSVRNSLLLSAGMASGAGTRASGRSSLTTTMTSTGTATSSDYIESSDDDMTVDSACEGSKGYRKGGYHPVFIGDVYNDRYMTLRKMGFGAFSTVWLCKDLTTGRCDVALKIQKAAPQYAEAAEDEITILEQVANGPANKTRLCVCLVDSFRHRGPNGTHVCMVFDLCGDNTLHLIKHWNYKGIPMHVLKRTAAQLLEALDYIHREKQIIHTDIKPENCLVADPSLLRPNFWENLNTSPVKRKPMGKKKKKKKARSSRSYHGGATVSGGALGDAGARASVNTLSTLSTMTSNGPPHMKEPNEDSEDETYHPSKIEDNLLPDGQAPVLDEDKLRNIIVKLSDLGNACWTHKHFTDQIQTRQYRSPEVIIGQPYDTSADMWSFAVMMFEFATGDFLFNPIPGPGYNRDEHHLILFWEALGPPPVAFATGGRYSRDFFDQEGALHAFKSHSIAPCPLAQLLMEDYGGPDRTIQWTETEAVAFADFLLPMLTWDTKERASAQQMLRHPWLTSKSPRSGTSRVSLGNCLSPAALCSPNSLES